MRITTLRAEHEGRDVQDGWEHDRWTVTLDCDGEPDENWPATVSADGSIVVIP